MILWAQQSSEDPVYAESLDFEALLLRNKLADHSMSEGFGLSGEVVLLLRNKLADHSMGQWRTEAAPLAHRALEIRESHRDTSPDDLALALELAADTYESGEPREPEAENLPIEKVGGQVTFPKLPSKVEATFGDVARLGGIQGTSVISVVVDTNGVPRHFGLRRGCGYGLDENAVQAVRQWRFRPATKNGQPVSVIANIEVSFRLARPATR